MVTKAGGRLTSHEYKLPVKYQALQGTRRTQPRFAAGGGTECTTVATGEAWGPLMVDILYTKWAQKNIKKLVISRLITPINGRK